MDDNIDVRVSPSLDPERLRLMDGYGDDTRQFLDPVVNAYSDIYQTLSKAHDARELAESNPAWTTEQRILIVSKDMDAARQRVLKRLANAERDLRANITHTEKLLSEPLAERAGAGTINVEIRAHVRALKQPDRIKFLKQALDADDDLTLTAVLGGPAYLSGLSQIDHEWHVRQYHEKKNPHLVRRLDLMNRFLGEVERNTPVIGMQFEKAIGASHKVTADLNKRNDQANAALAELKVERA